MVQTMLKKTREKKGFTLMEMLIVVAIIAILVAIAIPVFTAQLDKAKQAADSANYRSAKAAATVDYLDSQYNDGGSYDIAGKYFSTNGEWVTAKADGYLAQAAGTGHAKDAGIKAAAGGEVVWDPAT